MLILGVNFKHDLRFQCWKFNLSLTLKCGLQINFVCSHMFNFGFELGFDFELVVEIKRDDFIWILGSYCSSQFKLIYLIFIEVCI